MTTASDTLFTLLEDISDLDHTLVNYFRLLGDQGDQIALWRSTTPELKEKEVWVKASFIKLLVDAGFGLEAGILSAHWMSEELELEPV